ncbi:MAG: Eco57I restriction-modification methylase domain-containing protein [Dehalococcoidia bacterium]
MSNTIPQLKSIWNKEKESYKTQEVGSGVQRFVKDVLECTDIFNLKQGNLSTPSEKRKNEFIYEKKTKDRRKADFDIFINSDIEIPVEVEQYTNIEQGEGQLSQYQSDLQKKYGILTDGYTWRFYNNNIYRVLTLDHLLSDTAYFLEFWKEYIKPEYYYLSFFKRAGQLSFFGKEELHIEDNRQLFFKDITTLIKSLTHKLRIEGYFNGLERKEALKKATEITYAYIIQFILYKTLVDNRFDDFGNDYKGRIETIHNAIKTQSYKDILGVIDGMSHQISQNIYRPFVKEQEHIRDKLLKLYHEAKNELSDVSPWLDIVVFIKKYNFQNVHNEIFGYVYENYLKELYEDEKKGQYFTDPSIVNFMLEQVGYTAKEIRNRIKAGELDKLSIVDPACGSGTFLYRATDEVVKSVSTITDETSKQIEEIVTSNVFGLDIEEFPLYLAEMNILMRMLPLIMGEKYNNPLEKKIKVFWTQDSIAEFIGSELVTLGKQISFPDAIIKPKFGSFVRSEEDLSEMKGSMTSFPRRRFDYVIGNPPYIGYNECSKKGVLITKLIQDKKVQMSDIYGVNLNTVPGRIKAYAPKPNLYAFFIALGIGLLKDNGKLCYIIPQTILSAVDLDVLRYHLAKFTTIERIIIFSGKLFVGRGLKQDRPVATSSLIFVVSKRTPHSSHQVEIINYENAKDDIEECLQNISVGEKTTIKKIEQHDLLANVANWNFVKLNKQVIKFIDSYKAGSESMDVYRDYDLSQQRFKDIFIIDGSYNIPTKNVLTSKHDQNEEYYDIPILESDRFVIKSFNYYPKKSKIRIAKGGQGLKVAQTTYKVLWRYINPTRFYFVEGNNVLPRFQQFCIGSNNKEEIHYLFSLLNSNVNKSILRIYLTSENEKDMLIGVRTIKEFVRVPRITGDNQHIKDEIIRRTEEMLALEEKTLSDFVDFSGILVQKLDDVQVAGDTLVLVHDNRKIELPIKRDARLIASTIAERFAAGELKLEKHRISLSELRNMQVIDFEKSAKLKDYIDDLVFALYFNIPLKEVSLDRSEEIQKACSKNEYYQLL